MTPAHPESTVIDKKKLDLNLLAIFIEVFSHSSVTLASSALGISPSSVSQSLAKLREHFSDPLFVREGQALKPTRRAKVIYDSLQDDFDKLNRSILDVVYPEESNRIVIYCSPYLSVRLVPQISNLIWSKKPTCEVIHKSYYSDLSAHNDLPRFRTTDLTIDFKPNLSRSMENVHISDEELCFISASHHPRLREHLTKEMSQQEDFVIFETQDDEFWQSKLEINQSIGQRNIHFRSNSFLTLLSIVEASNKIGVVPLWMYERFKSSFNIKKLTSDSPLSPQPIFLTYNKSSRSDATINNIISHLLKRQV